MAQIFPGSNNICLLHPSGNHGHRNLGGKDHASPRYIFTNIEPITFKIFRKEDETILKQIEDEGEMVEPECYYPIIPMVLVNGGHGVGTGYSSTIPQYNPKDLIDNILRRIDGKPMIDMDPWFNGFHGTIEKNEKKNTYKISGKYELVSDDYNTVRINEIPIKRKQYCWIQDYKDYLDTLVSDDKKDKKIINNIKRKGGNDDVDFIIEFKPNEFKKLYKRGKDEIVKFFKLDTNMSVSNLHLYNANNEIIKYEDPIEIMEEFFEIRLEMYEKRRLIQLKILLNDLQILKYKIKFIEDYRSKKITIQDQAESEIVDNLISRKFPTLSYKYNALEEEKTYRYLTDMRLWSLTKEKINDLIKEHNQKKTEYDDYNATSALQLWKRELLEFETAYDKWVDDARSYIESYENDKVSKKKSKSKASESKPKKKSKSK